MNPDRMNAGRKVVMMADLAGDELVLGDGRDEQAHAQCGQQEQG